MPPQSKISTIACLDVAYGNATAAVAGALIKSWDAERASQLLVRRLDGTATNYEPGAFYKRELPLLSSIISEFDEAIEAIIIDGYVWLDGLWNISRRLDEIEQNMKLNTADPVARYGFTELPNFILRDPKISIGAKTAYSLLLSYAWHNNLCFPGQERLAQDMGMGVASVNRFTKELQDCALVEITRRGQGKTNLYTVNFVVKQRGLKS